MPISVMIKPSSSFCNLKCKYCFYSSLSSEREEYSKGFMNLETAESIIKSAVEYAKGTEIIFTFQGGEPMLSGIE
ncbi:MAG: 4Fe-4S cluster-binding domain-containing protein, partial [Eubacterium sp.]|nr:4Fe-4S cluster-binding domain-containing protein [Eubacterium sp.]